MTDWPTHAPKTPRPAHGTYLPGQGYYDATLNGWISDPAHLTPTVTREVTASNRDQVASWGTKPFRRVPELDNMLRLRDSDRQEERETYNKLAVGSRRIQVSDYEAALNKAIAEGHVD